MTRGPRWKAFRAQGTACGYRKCRGHEARSRVGAYPCFVERPARWSSLSARAIVIGMTDTSLDELGPVDYVVVEFPAGASNFTGEMAKELLALVDAGTIRVIDVLILAKNEDGTVDAMELADIEELGELQAVEAQLAELLAEEDVVNLAASMAPGSTAGVLI